MNLKTLGTSRKWRRPVLALCDWLISLSTASARVLQVVTCARISLLLMLGNVPWGVCTTFYLSAHQSMDIWRKQNFSWCYLICEQDLFLFIYLFIKFYCSITVVCIFSSPLYPTPAKPTSLPCFHPSPWFCPCVLYSSFWKPFSPLSLPPSPLAIVRLFLTSMSLVIFCLLFSFVDYGEGQIPHDLTFNWNIINRRKMKTKYNQGHWS